MTTLAALLLLCAPLQEKGKQEEGLLPADPGLDGGKGGHWGMQKEEDWKDGRFNRMDTGPVLHSAIDLPGGPVLKGLTVRLGDGAICYDTTTLAVRAAWTGGFVAFDPTRYGLIGTPRPAGKPVPAPKGKWEGTVRYLGFRLHGDRVELEYTVDGVRIRETPVRTGDAFIRSFAVDPRPRPLRFGDRVVEAGGEPVRFATGGVPAGDPAPPRRRWGGPIAVRGHLGRDAPYAVDTIPVPTENPWNALIFLSGLDFFGNGDAAACTVHGDVWIVRGIDDSLASVTWQRFATGLYQPLGLRIVDDRVLVTGRDRITRLHDDNGDGEADRYENFHDGIATRTGHRYVTCLETDAEGNIYYADTLGLHRVSPDGRTSETVAGGWRHPNGMSIGPDGTITVAPQEGEWTPASMICAVRPGGHYGWPGPKPGPDRPLGYDPPLCYVPRLIDNSTGGQVWVAGERWGPLRGALLNLSFGRSSMQLVLRDGDRAAAVVPTPVRFSSGAVRGRFRPQDGQLYVAGMRGWVSNALRDGCLQRVRHTGGPVPWPVGVEVRGGEVRIRFGTGLRRDAAEDPDRYAAEQWNYLYSKEYGSREYSVRHPGKVGHDPLGIRSARLLEDGRTVALTLDDLRPAHQTRIRYSLKDAEGGTVRGELVATIHRTGK